MGVLGGRRVGARRLRELLERGDLVSVPGVYDALGARLVEEAGFPAVYMTGFGSAAALGGMPDVGLLTMSEMVENARRIVQAVDIPLIADADTGYGNPINVIRAVRCYEAAGVAAIHIEDQAFPKRCGHLTGKQVVPAEEMVQKVRAAVYAREDEEFVIIARTDARAVEGLESAVERARAYREAGADVLFVEAVESEKEAETVARELAGTPLLFNWVEGGKTPPLSAKRLEEMGYSIVIFPISTLLGATRGMRRVLREIRERGTPEVLSGESPSFSGFVEFIGLPQVRELEERFGG